MGSYTETSLWKASLASRPDAGGTATRARNRLSACFERFRERAGTIADEIGRSYPSLTVHGLVHLDALWEMANILAGDGYPLNPAEAFVLGGAFLTHDLGNGLAGFPEGEEDLLHSQEAKDFLGLLLRSTAGRPATEAELQAVPPAIKQKVLESTLRARHAQQAPILLKRPFSTSLGDIWLIEDVEVRNHYAGIIGEVAESHWWSLAEVARRFHDRILGAASWEPAEWVVDAAKIACLLRVSDAAHLDSRRAPPMLRALRAPTGISAAHWEFQGRLSQPVVMGKKLLYTSGSSFPIADADAWWLAFDALRLLDREIRDVNKYLAETDSPQSFRPCLNVEGVAGTESPQHLTKHIRADGWQPTDVTLTVGDVTRLVQTLGGTALYGDDPVIPLRELIQNAADAIRARRVLERRDPAWGQIVVREGRDGEGIWIEVEDTGVGMSEEVLLRTLLDFGKSLWSNELLLIEHPGLAGSAFCPSGRFGIGFFSVFMWGDKVEVTTRRFDEDPANARVLLFNSGLSRRPLLRTATRNERLIDGGTRVRVWLHNEGVLRGVLEGKQESRGGIWEILRGPQMGVALSLEARCAWLAPSLDVTLLVGHNGEAPRPVVTANDWITVDPRSLVARILGVPSLGTDLALIADAMEIVHDDEGVPAARIAAGGPTYPRRSAVLVENGLQVAEVSDVTGIVAGSCRTADRRSGVSHVPPSALEVWAVKQTSRYAQAPASAQAHAASILNYFGADISELRCFVYEGDKVSLRDLRVLIGGHAQFTVTDGEIPDDYLAEYPEPHIFFKEHLEHTAVFDTGAVRLDNRRRTIGDAIAETAAGVWGCPIEDVMEASELDVSAECTDEYERSLDLKVHVVRRPRRETSDTSTNAT